MTHTHTHKHTHTHAHTHTHTLVTKNPALLVVNANVFRAHRCLCSQGASTVTLSGVPCLFGAGSSWSAGTIVCTVQYPMGGPNFPYVNIAGAGYATSYNSFTGVTSISSFTPATSSYGGGQVLTLTGTGFASSANVPMGKLLQTMTAQVCGQPCAINTAVATPTSLQCTLPELVTADSIEAFQQTTTRLTQLTGKVTSLNMGAPALAFDGNLQTWTQDSYWYVTAW